MLNWWFWPVVKSQLCTCSARKCILFYSALRQLFTSSIVNAVMPRKCCVLDRKTKYFLKKKIDYSSTKTVPVYNTPKDLEELQKKRRKVLPFDVSASNLIGAIYYDFSKTVAFGKTKADTVKKFDPASFPVQPQVSTCLQFFCEKTSNAILHHPQLEQNQFIQDRTIFSWKYLIGGKFSWWREKTWKCGIVIPYKWL